MKKIFLCLAAIFLIISLKAQINNELWKKWDSEVIAKANTAGNESYLSEEEKKIILFTNLARLDGQLFSQTFLDDYLKDKKPTKYTRSLYKDLKNVKGLPPLHSQQDLYKVAKGHAEKSGKRGSTGHQEFEKRFKPLMGKYNAVAENCAYGYNEAIDIVIGLLVDEKIKDLGHRENMLNPDYNSVGVSIEPHKSYRYNCVMDFGRKIK